MKIITLAVFTQFLIIINLQGQKGRLFDTINCKNNPKQAYALYLPEHYSESVKLPVVFFFEPRARALLPLNKYQDLANTHNCILACTWKSKNGPFESSNEAAYAMITDVYLNYKIDTSLIILSGFSGGSRFSSHYASKNIFVHGVIACGAGLSNNITVINLDKIRYSPIVGTKDFNFNELYKLKSQTIQQDNPIPFFVYEGNHSWPPAEDFERALIFQLKTENTGKELKHLFLNKENVTAAKASQNNDLVLKSWCFENICTYYREDKCGEPFSDSLEVLYHTKDYKKQYRRFKRSILLEDSLRNEINTASFAIYLTSFNQFENHKTMVWWENKIKSFRKLEESNKLYASCLGTRLVGQIKVQMWEGHRTLTNKKFYQAALENANILMLIDKDNPGYNLLKAESLVALGRINEAQKIIDSLNKKNIKYNSRWKQNKFLKKIL